jgi:UV DNA damage endonuclease
MSYNNIVLVDTSYIYQRVTACMTYCKKADKYFSDEMVYENFCSNIKKLVKKTGTPVENMILCRDVWPVWRFEDYPSYKQNRTQSQGYGPHVRELYKRIEKLFNVVLRIEGAEADDIIAILCGFYLKQNTNNHIYVISNDKDFYQLPFLFTKTKSKRIHLLDNSKFTEHDSSEFSMHEKVVKGDRSDNVKKLPSNYTVQQYLKNKQLMDLSYVPRYIQDRIFNTGYFSLNSNIKPLSIQLGFACINTELREKDIFCSRTLRQQTFCDKGVKFVKELVKNNIQDLKKLVQWNIENGIRFMRVSSDMFPHYTNDKCPSYTMNFVKKDLAEIGRIARLYKIRLTMHPSQFNVLSNWENPKVLENTIKDLRMHTDILNMMELDQDSICVIHGGGIYNNKPKAIETFIKNFNSLDEDIRNRLVIENCERCYNIEDMLYISENTGAPVIFDTHHYNCYKICNKDRKSALLLKEAKEYIPQILETWIRRGIKPKFHISEQRPGERIGAHSNFVECIPEYLLEIPKKYGIDVDIMIEAKFKEKAVFHLYKKYPQLSPF